MANNISGNPWFLDTPGVIYTANVKIKRLVWSEQVTAGDVLLIKDNAGRTIVASKAYQPNFVQDFAYEGWYEGFNLVTLASGVVAVYLSF